MRGWLRRFWWLAGAGLAALAVAVWLVWPSSGGRAEPVERARGFVDFTVCVLTDARGVAGSDAAPVWQGVLTAQKSTNAKTQYLATLGDGSVGAAVISLNTLAARGCGLIVAVGASQSAAVWKQAEVFPLRHFVVVGGFALAKLANVAVIVEQAPDAVASKVSALAAGAVAGRFVSGPVS